MTVIAAVLLTDRKPVFPVALEYLVKEPLVEAIYLNVQTFDQSKYVPILKFLMDAGKPFSVDYWQVISNWIVPPKFDQDPARFMPIAKGRNDALDWAIVQCMMNQSVSHLLFVDSDVRPHAGGLQHLLDLKKPLTGGLVPGRGVHSGVNYVYGEMKPLPDQPKTLIRCVHGTSGYFLIERHVFEVLRFRSGPAIEKRHILICDDPAYCDDARIYGYADAVYIDTRATADHVDDPTHPLTLDQAINNYHVGGSSA